MVVAVGWDMYDPRLTIKGKAATAFEIGYCGYIKSSDGLLYATATDFNGSAVETVHGCALKKAAIDDELVLITHGRLKMVTEQTEGNLIKGPTVTDSEGVSPPSTTLTGRTCGFAIEDYLVFVHIDNASAV